MTIQAFIDHNYPAGTSFCQQFLASPEFRLECLKSIHPSLTSGDLKTKSDVAARLATMLERKEVSAEKILMTYVKQPRMWFSFKLGNHEKLPKLGQSETLLTEYCEDGWYGPINDKVEEKAYYIRTHTASYYTRTTTQDGEKVEALRIRWSPIVEVSKKYIAISWNGFSSNNLEDEGKAEITNASQFPFWKHIGSFFDELNKHLGGKWEHSELHKLILSDLWNKYINYSDTDFKYYWRHLRIRAEAAGVALNAHSSGMAEVDIRGIQALSHQLAKSALESIELLEDKGKLSLVENAIIRTLIHEWGAKSYEFSLEKEEIFKEDSSDNESKKRKPEKIFRAHCYFGLKQDSKVQDSLQHLKCYSQYGNNLDALNFLLKELNSED